jgi:hypothetical protein
LDQIAENGDRFSIFSAILICDVPRLCMALPKAGAVSSHAAGAIQAPISRWTLSVFPPNVML